MKVKNKVDNGNARENKGKVEKCNESTLAYYRGLYDNSPEARQIKVEIFSKLDDFDLISFTSECYNTNDCLNR